MNSTSKLLVAAFVLGSAFAASQQSGTATFGASDDHDIDSIDLATLTPSVGIRVLRKSGAVHFDYSVMLRSACTVSGQPGATSLTCGPEFVGNRNKPQLIGTSLLIGMRLLYGNSSVSGNCTTYSQYSLIDATGTTHTLPKNGSYTICGSSTGSGGFTNTTLDDSGYTVTVSGSANTFQVWDASGNHTNKTTPVNNTYTSSETDPFGNSVSLSGGVYTDSLAISALTSVSSPYAGWQWIDTNAHTQDFYEEPQSALNVNINLGCVAYPNTSGSASPYVYSYPDGTSISIGLEQGSGGPGTTTNRISSVTLRTGGQITYTYGSLTCLGTAPEIVIPSSLTRTTPDGTTKYTWNGSSSQATVTKLDPGMNKTVYTFTGLNPCNLCTYQTTLTQVQTYQNVGTVPTPSYQLLTTDLYCYNGNTTNCSANLPAYPITQKDAYHYVGTGSMQVNHITTLYDKYGNVTSSSTYDYISGVTLTTTTQYGSWNGSSCAAIGNNINDKPCDVKRVDGSSHTLSEVRNTYNTTTGALTASSLWTGSIWLTTNYTVNGNGTVASSTAPNGLVTNYAYNGTGGCNNLLVTSTTQTVASGDTLTSSQQWNCNGAVVMNTTDPNGATTSTTYDAMFRPLSFTDKLGALTSTTYSSTTIEVSQSFNSGNSIDDTIKTVDGLGRTTRTQHKQGPQAPNSSNYDTVTTAYSWNGPTRQTSVTTACTQTLGNDCTSNYTTSTYDPLQRGLLTTDASGGTHTYSYLNTDSSVALGPAPIGENTKTVQREVDGLARTISVCSLEPSGGGTSCGQAMGNSGVLNTYAYTLATGSTTTSVTRGSQTKTTVKDALGRMTSYTSPEASSAWTYIYDSTDSRCGSVWSSYGDLMETVDPNGNVVCYKYDALHRKSGVNPVGSGVKCQGFVYGDSSYSLPSGVGPIHNGNGQLVNAYTNTACNGRSSLETDEWFSYDAAGRITDLWELTPHSGGYYHTTIVQEVNGALLSLSGIPGMTTDTYTLDGEGRENAVAEGTTQIISSVTYTAFQKVSQINIVKGGDHDTYVYGALGQVTKWIFSIGSASQTGNVYWNANGTPYEIQVTDGFNSAGTQDCKFYNPGYDDLNRLLNVACDTSGWGQTFSYDQYDNLTKQVMSGHYGSTWSPGYSSSTNYISGGTYDSNGNMTYDGVSNYYSWDSYSRLSSINSSGTNCATSGVCLTYDALGRIVEKSTGSAYTQVLYSSVGKTAVMSGQTVSYAYIPLPGGMTEYKTNDSTRHLWHKDWIANARVVATLSGTVEEGSAVSPYGEIESQNIYGTLSTEFSFTGDTQDLTAGLFDTPARELNQSVGRWINPDPAGASWNAYRYPTNPNIAIDPFGAMQFYHTDCCQGLNNGLDAGDSYDKSTSYVLEYGSGDGALLAQTPPVAAPGKGTTSGESQAQAAQNQGCKYDACVTAQAPKKSIWQTIGGWFSGAALGIVRWGKLGGPLHREGIERVSRSLEESGFKVQREVRIPTPNGARSSRWVDVVGTRNGEVRMYQIGRQNLDGTPVAREVQAMDDIEGATGIRPNFLPYNIGDPNFGVPGANDIAPGERIAPGEGEVPVEPETIPE